MSRERLLMVLFYPDHLLYDFLGVRKSRKCVLPELKTGEQNIIEEGDYVLFCSKSHGYYMGEIVEKDYDYMTAPVGDPRRMHPYLIRFNIAVEDGQDLTGTMESCVNGKTNDNSKELLPFENRWGFVRILSEDHACCLKKKMNWKDSEFPPCRG
ncbi:MAG: hypothetical protein ACP5UO_00980 [Thermoplasmata archaeon]